jgi:hypothetical protein
VVLNYDVLSVSAVRIRVHHLPVGYRSNRRANGSGEVDTIVVSSNLFDGMFTNTEVARHARPHHWIHERHP